MSVHGFPFGHYFLPTDTIEDYSTLDNREGQ